MNTRQSILQLLHGLLENSDFHQRGRIFARRPCTDLLQIVGYESGRGAVGGLFRLNLGIFIPFAEFARTGRTITHPTDHECHVRLPLHSLAGIKTWGIPVDEDWQKLRKWLGDSIEEFAIPFFAKHASVNGLLQTDWANFAPRTLGLDGISRAALLVLSSDEVSARRTLAEEYVSRSHSPAGSAEIVIQAAGRLRLSDFVPSARQSTTQ